MTEIDRTMADFIGRNPIGHNAMIDISNNLIE